MVRHVGAYFICTSATLDNKWIFVGDMKPFNEVISSLGEIYCVYPTGWFFAVYGNVRFFPSFQFNPRTSKVNKCILKKGRRRIRIIH